MLPSPLYMFSGDNFLNHVVIEPIFNWFRIVINSKFSSKIKYQECHGDLTVLFEIALPKSYYERQAKLYTKNEKKISAPRKKDLYYCL